MSTYEDANAFLMGGGIPGAKFPTKGTVVKGEVTNIEQVQQREYKPGGLGDLLFYDDGKPRMQLVVTLRTDERDPNVEGDDGLRKLYVKGQMLAAVRSAVRAVQAPGLERGGTLAVVFHDTERVERSANERKLYRAQYKAPAFVSVGAAEAPEDTPAASDLI